MAYLCLTVLLQIKSLERHMMTARFLPHFSQNPSSNIALLTCCPLVTIITEVIVIVTDEIVYEYQRAVPLLNE